jgi:hypothetical protein
MVKPLKTVFMDLVEVALKTTIPSDHDVQRRPTLPADRDTYKTPFIRFAYTAARRRRDNRVQHVEFDLHVEASVERTKTDSVDIVGEVLQADIEKALAALANSRTGGNPQMKIECIADDILYFDNELQTGMAVSIYSVALTHEYGDPYKF